MWSKFSHKFGNAIPNIIIINVNIEFDSKFGTSIPNPITVKVITQFNRSIPILLCTDRKYEVPTETEIIMERFRSYSDHRDNSEAKFHSNFNNNGVFYIFPDIKFEIYFAKHFCHDVFYFISEVVFAKFWLSFWLWQIFG